MQIVIEDRFSIFPMNEKDLDSVMEIDESYSTAPWSRETFAKELENKFSYNFVIIFNKEVAGFINFWVICDVIELNNFAIKEEFRGKGLGKAFLMFLIECGKILNVKRIFLEVKKDNLTALTLYKKLGFYASGLRKGYYSDGNDAVLMEKIL